MGQDELLFKQFVSGDNNAFEQIVVKHKDNLILFLSRYVKDLHICEDISQDVFVFLFVYKERYKYKSSLKTYIYTVGKNKAIDFIRKQNKNISLIESIDGQFEEDIIEKLMLDEQKEMLNNCLKKIKIDYAIAIHLIDFEDFSYKETSEILKKTVPQVKILIYRARNSLKLLLEKEGYMIEV